MGTLIHFNRPASAPAGPEVDAMIDSGSLFLFDAAHSQNPGTWGLNTVPADGGTVPNLAWEQAATIVGSGTESTLAGAYDATASFYASDGTKRGAVERTTKGGLHVAVAQATPLASTDGAHVRLPQSVRDYIAANPSHTYFAQFLHRATRRQPSGAASSAELMSVGTTTNASNRVIMVRTDGLTGAPVGSRTANLNVADTVCDLTVAQAGAGTPLANGRVSWGAGTGTLNATGSVFTNLNAGYWPSFVLYRWGIWDLTVSGKTFADMDTLAAAATTSAFGTGGRYAGDTWTAPSTLAA